MGIGLLSPRGGDKKVIMGLGKRPKLGCFGEKAGMEAGNAVLRG